MSKAIKLGAFVLVTLVMPQEHADAAPRMRAQVYITQSNIPKKGNERSLINFARKNQAKRLKEQSDKPIKERKWIADMVVAFNAPPGDLEYHALFFDVTGGSRRFVDDMATMINDRKQRTFLQKMKLRRPQFEPGKKYEVVITIRRAEIGKTTFETLGERPHRSGRVDFSDDDTK